MKKYIIKGQKKLVGDVTISGAKNVITKALIAACLTDEEVILENVPLINDFFVMLELVREIGGRVTLSGHTVKIKMESVGATTIPLEIGAKIKTSSMFLAPLLIRAGRATIPNPGGCRIGARPIDRHIQGLIKMGAEVGYASEDGYFHAQTKGLVGTEYTFEKTTHTGTETLILVGVLARGQTILRNAAQEPEIDDLIRMLAKMGAKIKRAEPGVIVIDGVEKLHGATHRIISDRNEAETFAVISALTGGNIYIHNCDLLAMSAFLEVFKIAGGAWEEKNGAIRFYIKEEIRPVDVVTRPHPGFMTDWQGPWSILMTQANGESVIHETIYENRFAYVRELAKMGAKLSMFQPNIVDPTILYNFNYEDQKASRYRQALRISGKTPLHNAVLNIFDLRAGATLVIAALIAAGTSVIYGVELLERGYEAFDVRLRNLGADIIVDEEGEMKNVT